MLAQCQEEGIIHSRITINLPATCTNVRWLPQQPLLKLEAYEKYQMDEYYRGTGQKGRAVRNLAEFLGREVFFH
ncbi:unnamed protein product [Caenorhabditis sp. 36 PRJEB53466]|nr:unnamed protein product [Caenorhabditis sp. 36 PRJEB53466]